MNTAIISETTDAANAGRLSPRHRYEGANNMAKQSLYLNREELAWAAGFFDGEGHSRRGDRGALAITISQADSPELLYRFQRAVGVGTVRGPYVHKARPKQRPFYVYDALGYENVQHCMCVLWRWLGTVKRAQAKASLARWMAKPRKWFMSAEAIQRRRAAKAA